MPNSQLTEIVIVMDRSGSMSPIAKDMEGGVELLLTEQAKVPGECRFTLVQFDSTNQVTNIETVYESVPVALFAGAGRISLVPRGMTPLNDAVGHTIRRTGERYAAFPDDRRPGKVIFVIITDGDENSSKVFTTAQVQAMVKHQTDVYQWQFVFLGANVDAFAEGEVRGVRRASTANYTANASGVRAAFVAASDSTVRYRSSTEPTASLTFTDEERAKMAGKKDA